MVMLIVRFFLGENHRLRGWQAVKANPPRFKTIPFRVQNSQAGLAKRNPPLNDDKEAGKVLTHRARAARFVEPDQADANSPVLLAKIFLFPLDPNQIYKPRHPVPLEGRIARRQAQA